MKYPKLKEQNIFQWKLMFVGIFSEKSTEYFSFKCTRCEYSNEIGENRMELKTIEVVTQMFVKTVF